MQKKWVMILIVVLITFCICSCENSLKSDSLKIEKELETILEENEKELKFMQASWNTNYGTLDNIVQDSDYIALIEVNGIDSKTKINSGIPITIFKATVVKPIYGVTENQELRILQTGGETETQIIEFEDNPLMEIGEKYLIFGRDNKDGTIRIAGGPQGRLIYENQQYTSLNLGHERLKTADIETLSLNILNQDEESLYDEIYKCIENK